MATEGPAGTEPGAENFLQDICQALNLAPDAPRRMTVQGTGALPSFFPVTGLAVSAIGAAGLALAELIGLSEPVPRVVVDRRLASLWFGWSIKPLGWEMPSAWDPIAGDYCAQNGWIRLHTNAPRHRVAALSVLGCEAEREAVAGSVSAWTAEALEQAVVDAGGCAAAMRAIAAWQAHPQGAAVAAEPLIAFDHEDLPGLNWRPRPGRPLAGLKVLDLTRVLAGPIATRFLAGFGADVLRIDPPDWGEPGVIPEVTLGKSCARLDLREAAGRAVFERLLAEADMLVHGYRPGALDALGFDPARRRAIQPRLLEVTLDAYGWTGPWRMRRGFDSLVQMSSGIAAAGMEWRQAERPVPLPVQALDHATGYLAAAAAIRLLTGRLRDERIAAARLSLARTAALLVAPEPRPTAQDFARAGERDFAPAEEATGWGPARRLLAPVTVGEIELCWDLPATRLGVAAPQWRN